MKIDFLQQKGRIALMKNGASIITQNIVIINCGSNSFELDPQFCLMGYHDVEDMDRTTPLNLNFVLPQEDITGVNISSFIHLVVGV